MCQQHVASGVVEAEIHTAHVHTRRYRPCKGSIHVDLNPDAEPGPSDIHDTDSCNDHNTYTGLLS